MYCHTSSSVQFEMGNTRMCSPLRCRPLKRFHSSGRWFFGSHCPNSSRKEYTLLGPGLVLVAAAATEDGIEAVLLDRVQERDALEPVADGLRARILGDPAGVDRRLDGADDELGAQLGDPAVPVVDDLGEVVAGVDVHQREGEPGGPEGLLGDLQHHRGVLAAGEEEHGVLELGGDLTEDVDRLGLERVEMRDRGFRHLATPAPSLRPNGRRDYSRAP